jgi:NTE family protein
MRSAMINNAGPSRISRGITEACSAESRLSLRAVSTGNDTSQIGPVARQLSSLALLHPLDEISLGALEAELVRICLPGGEMLFRENDFADALYIVIAGCLAVTVRSNGRDVLVARIRAGEIVGEMALLDGGLRSATVEAVRDTELLRLDRPSYERLVERHPKSMLTLTSLLSKRLRDTTHRLDGQVPVRTVAIVPLGPDADHCGVAHDLARSLLDDGHRALLLDHGSAAHTSEWFDAAETASDLVLYCAEPSDNAWTKLCLRQSDRVLLIASSASRYAPSKWLADQLNQLRQPLDLALLDHGSASCGRAVERWRERLRLDAICHIRRHNAEDVARLGRVLRGAAVGLVLSSGGARGFAHLGVVRALREAKIPIDLIGGCSMGAIVGAAVALEWDDAEIRERLRHAFAKSNPVNDYTFPFVALTKGQKLVRLLKEQFGSVRIEDLWRPYFCVSTNLSAGTLAVHRDGVLAHALQASASIPGLLPPVMIAGEAHVDGGVMNWLPVDVMGSHRGTVIAVDAASDSALMPLEETDGGGFSIWQTLRGRRRIPPIVDLLVRTVTVGSEALGRAARAQADILFKPPLENIDLLDWQACDHVIETGYRHAIATLDRLNRRSPKTT